jgi:hypothetical protein
LIIPEDIKKSLNSVREIEGFTTGAWLGLCDYVGVIALPILKSA